MFELILVSCDCMDLNQSNTQLKAPSTCIRIYLKTLNENATFQKHSTLSFRCGRRRSFVRSLLLTARLLSTAGLENQRSKQQPSKTLEVNIF